MLLTASLCISVLSNHFAETEYRILHVGEFLSLSFSLTLSFFCTSTHITNCFVFFSHFTFPHCKGKALKSAKKLRLLKTNFLCIICRYKHELGVFGACLSCLCLSVPRCAAKFCYSISEKAADPIELKILRKSIIDYAKS